MKPSRLSSWRMGLSRARKIRSSAMTVVISLMAGVAIIPLFLVFYHVVRQGLPAMSWSFFTSLPTPVGQAGGGMANALIGSIVLVALGTLIGVPIGVLGGVFLAEYGRGKLAVVLRFTVDLLTSIPSIIVGLYIYAIIVVPTKTFSSYAGAVALAILMFPFIVKTTEEVLKLIPSHIREAGLALEFRAGE